MTPQQGQAERAGFEPAVRFDPHTAFPVPRLRPLGHLSDNSILFLPLTLSRLRSAHFWVGFRFAYLFAYRWVGVWVGSGLRAAPTLHTHGDGILCGLWALVEVGGDGRWGGRVRSCAVWEAVAGWSVADS